MPRMPDIAGTVITAGENFTGKGFRGKGTTSKESLQTGGVGRAAVSQGVKAVSLEEQDNSTPEGGDSIPPMPSGRTMQLLKLKAHQ